MKTLKLTVSIECPEKLKDFPLTDSRIASLLLEGFIDKIEKILGDSKPQELVRLTTYVGNAKHQSTLNPS